MNKEEKIRKWLAGELSETEKNKFELSSEFVEIKRLLKAVKSFKAPDYGIDTELNKLSKNIFHQQKTINFYKKISPLLKIAAILIFVIGTSLFSYKYFSKINIKGEWFAEQGEVYLPDSSLVILNSGSRLRYSIDNWANERNVQLEGEAFFKVKKGSLFNVSTENGTVEVLGTEFDVKDWGSYYEVTCYTGLVKVNTSEKSVLLKPNSVFRNIGENDTEYTISNQSEPTWLKGESTFKSVPLVYVFEELERQYETSVKTINVDLNQLFTGSFLHNNLKLSLEAITIPVNLDFEIKKNQIIISVEDK